MLGFKLKYVYKKGPNVLSFGQCFFILNTFFNTVCFIKMIYVNKGTVRKGVMLQNYTNCYTWWNWAISIIPAFVILCKKTWLNNPSSQSHQSWNHNPCCWFYHLYSPLHPLQWYNYPILKLQIGLTTTNCFPLFPFLRAAVCVTARQTHPTHTSNK